MAQKMQRQAYAEPDARVYFIGSVDVIASSSSFNEDVDLPKDEF